MPIYLIHFERGYVTAAMLTWDEALAAADERNGSLRVDEATFHRACEAMLADRPFGEGVDSK